MKILRASFKRRLAFTAVLVTIAFVIGAYRTEINSHSLIQERQNILQHPRYVTQNETILQELFQGNKGPSYKTIRFPKETMYINSAMIGNSTPDSGWDLLLLTVWSSDISDGQCCALYEDGNIRSFNIVAITYRKEKSVILQINGNLVQCIMETFNHLLPIAASLAPRGTTCNQNTSFYYPVEVVKKQEHGSIGICTKVAYGTIDGRFLIEWFEIQKYLGISMVYTQIDPVLNDDARKVFSYYQSKGVMIAKRFDLPEVVKTPIWVRSAIMYTNLRLATMDCMEHLRGYTYVSVLDFDEFIIPNDTHSWRDMLSDLFASSSDAAGFRFQTAMYINDWGKSHPENKFTVAQYLKRSKPFYDRHKLIFQTDRVGVGDAETHMIWPKEGYRSYQCPPETGFIRHYRGCRRAWNSTLVPVNYSDDLCWNVTKRIEDTTMQDIASKIENNIMQVRREIFGD